LRNCGSTARGHGQRTAEVGAHLSVELLGRQLLEEAGDEARGVVDQHVDATEALDSGGDGLLGLLRVGDFETGDEEVVVLADDGGDSLGVAAGGHDVVPGGQCRLRRTRRPCPGRRR
jgi:hypothetical protein